MTVFNATYIHLFQEELNDTTQGRHMVFFVMGSLCMSH